MAQVAEDFSQLLQPDLVVSGVGRLMKQFEAPSIAGQL
jgi:hypothetical protein